MFEKCTSEEDVKAEIQETFFKKFKVERNRLDFAIDSLLWAEAKKAKSDVYEMLTQLLLTIKQRIDNGEFPPKFLGCFDTQKIAFVDYAYAQEIFSFTDFNWTEKPSSVSKKSTNVVRKLLSGSDKNSGNIKTLIYYFEKDSDILHDFIDANFITHKSNLSYARINNQNFVLIFKKWLEVVFPTIAAPLEILKKNGIIEGDFFLADVLSKNNRTISDKLKIYLDNDKYRLAVGIKDGLFTTSEIQFKDKMQAHAEFWCRYERPPEKECCDHIPHRRDLLVPKHIRERKGAFFTPEIWVKKSQKYLAEIMGNNWEDKYFIWDCCCGTGNLEAGLVNPYNVWCSTIDSPDVDIIKSNIVSGRVNLLESHIFQFDFLNDEFSALPDELCNIIATDEKQRKLIIYMNPPYAEGGNNDKRGKGKKGVNASIIQQRYAKSMGRANQELFAQFMARVYKEIPQATLATFGTLKYVNSPHFQSFRDFFRAEYKGGFIVCSDTFDNVKGKFPIGFLVWNQRQKQSITEIDVDILDAKGERLRKKHFVALSGENKLINDWMRDFDKAGEIIGYIGYDGNDFQQQDVCFLMGNDRGHHTRPITNKNLADMAVYFSARHCIPHTWINHNDQFLQPKLNFKNDQEFVDDCLLFTLFHHKNKVAFSGGANPWIPFEARQVSAKNNFQNGYMSGVLKGKALSATAQKTYDSGLEFWKYYHNAIKSDSIAYLNASLYEIREYFRGRNESGKMHAKAKDERFNELDSILKNAINELAEKISKKIYEYGFLI